MCLLSSVERSLLIVARDHGGWKGEFDVYHCCFHDSLVRMGEERTSRICCDQAILPVRMGAVSVFFARSALFAVDI